MESNTRKFINFDLNTNLMKTYNLSRYYVYSNIKTYMEKIILHIYNILGMNQTKLCNLMK